MLESHEVHALLYSEPMQPYLLKHSELIECFLYRHSLKKSIQASRVDWPTIKTRNKWYILYFRKSPIFNKLCLLSNGQSAYRNEAWFSQCLSWWICPSKSLWRNYFITIESLLRICGLKLGSFDVKLIIDIDLWFWISLRLCHLISRGLCRLILHSKQGCWIDAI
jgi:hypothetical protein